MYENEIYFPKKKLLWFLFNQSVQTHLQFFLFLWIDCVPSEVYKLQLRSLFTDPLFPGGVLLGILGGGVPPGSPNPDPISDQKMQFSTLVFDQTSKIHTGFQTWPLGRTNVIITLDQSANKLKILRYISNSHIFRSFLLIWSLLKR